MTMKTGLITLRPLKKEDYHPIQDLMNTFKDAKLFNQSSLFFQKDIFFHYVNEPEQPESYHTILDANTERFVGLIGLVQSTHDTEAELVIVIKPEYQGLGYADEAMRQIMAYAFETLNLASINIVTEIINQKAIDLFRRFNAVKTEQCDEACQCYIITKDNYQQVKHKSEVKP